MCVLLVNITNTELILFRSRRSVVYYFRFDAPRDLHAYAYISIYKQQGIRNYQQNTVAHMRNNINNDDVCRAGFAHYNDLYAFKVSPEYMQIYIIYYYREMM